jgi:hypothetical protein
MLVGRRRTTRQGGRRRATAEREREEGSWGGRTATAGRETKEQRGISSRANARQYGGWRLRIGETCSQAKRMPNDIRMQFLFPIL